MGEVLIYSCSNSIFHKNLSLSDWMVTILLASPSSCRNFVAVKFTRNFQETLVLQKKRECLINGSII